MSRATVILLTFIVVSIVAAMQGYVASVEAYYAAVLERVAEPAPEAPLIEARWRAKDLLESDAPLSEEERALVERVLDRSADEPSTADLAMVVALWQSYQEQLAQPSTVAVGHR